MASDLMTRSEPMNPHTFWVEAPHVSSFQGVVGAYLDLKLQDRVRKALEKQLIHSHVKSRDDLL